MKKNKIKKTVVLIFSFIIVALCAVGGTLAWLKDSTQTITNTFKYGKVDIELVETAGNYISENNYEFLISEGATITKDPKVIVKGGSEDSYIFLKISGEYREIINYEINPQWTVYNRPLNEDEILYYMIYTQTEEDVEFEVFKDNVVKVKDGLTNEELESYKKSISLEITAYAVQAYNENGMFQIDDAWDIVESD